MEVKIRTMILNFPDTLLNPVSLDTVLLQKAFFFGDEVLNNKY